MKGIVLTDNCVLTKSKLSFSDKSLEVIGGDSSFLTSFSSIHRFLNYIRDLLSGLVQHFVHILSHWMLSTEILVGTLGCFGVGVERRLVLF